MKAVGVIPARLASTRLPEKVLRMIHGRPMIEHVWKQASASKKLSEVWIACDDEKVKDCAEAFGAKAMMTRLDHPNGSSRVAEIASKVEGDVFVNIQGDEPLLDPQLIDDLVSVFEEEVSVQVATAAVRRNDEASYQDPNVVKVVCNQQKEALYFSRSPIPYDRDGLGERFSFLKHLGIYAYRKEFVLDFVKWPTSDLENTEKLEQLRILDRGQTLKVIETLYDAVSVDTEEDLKEVERLIH